MEEQTKEVLALAWTLFNLPLWEARAKMQKYLEEHFTLREERDHDMDDGYWEKTWTS